MTGKSASARSRTYFSVVTSHLTPGKATASASPANALRTLLILLGLAFPLTLAAQTSFGSVNVGATSAATVTVSMPAADTLASISVLTQGVPNLDFTNAGGGSCARSTAYGANSTCTVRVTFAPQYAGVRYGAVVLQDAGGNVMGSTYLQGTGMGAQIGYLPYSFSGGFLTESLCTIFAAAVDAAGSVYVTCPKSSAAYKETPTAKGYSETQIAFGLEKPDGLYSPQGIAVDGAGNVYISDSTQNRVVKETPSASGYSQTTVVTGLQAPMGIAVDGAGNLYIADSLDTSVYKETLSGSTYTQSTIGSGFKSPTGIAVDGSGNVFVASPADLYMFAYSGGSYTSKLLGSGFDSPLGIAVDGVGNVYVEDANNIYKETLATGAYTQSAFFSTTSLNAPFNYGLAVDSPGNLWVVGQFGGGMVEVAQATAPANQFNTVDLGILAAYPITLGVMDIGNEPLQLSQITFPPDFPEGTPVSNPPDFPPDDPAIGECAGGDSLSFGAYCTLTINFLPVAPLNGQTSLTLNEDVSLATNSMANGGKPQLIPVGGGEAQPLTSVALISSADPSTVGQLVTFTASVSGTAVIPTGNVTFNLFAAGSLQPTAVATVPLSSSGQATYSMPASPAGTYFYNADYSGDENYKAASSSQIAQSVVPSAGVADFGDTTIGSVQVGASSSVVPLTITFTATETLGSIAVLTQGAPNLDFGSATGGSCATGHAYAVNDTCTVNVVFKPRLPGPRYGAVTLADSNGNVVGTGYLQGTGLGPQAVFSPAALKVLSGTFDYPKGLTVDASGDIFFADSGIAKLTLSNGSYTQSLIAGSGSILPTAVAVDGSGNVYAAGNDNRGTVYKETPSNGSYTQTPIGYSLSWPQGVAVDGAGNVYIANSAPGQVYKETLLNGGYVQSLVGTGWGNPTSVAVDGSGNVYVVDQGFLTSETYASGPVPTPTLLKMTLTNASYTRSVIDNTFQFPVSVAVDSAGNLYVADNGNGQGNGFLRKETPQPDGTYTQSTPNSTLKTPHGVAVDGSGNIYVSDWDGKPGIDKLDISDSPSLSFATTALGATSADSPKVIAISNQGNASLDFSAVSYPADFPKGSPSTGDCVSNTALAAGANCTLTIDFSPVAAGALGSSNALAESVTITTNQLNAPATQQAIAVTGTEDITALPTFTISGPPISVAPGATSDNTSTITLTPSGGFTGTISLSCAITPAAASDPATCTIPASVSISSAAAQTVTLTVNTTAATSSLNRSRQFFWPVAGGASLAALLLFGIPSRRRGWRAMLGMLVIVLAIDGGVSACGGGGSIGGGGGGGNAGTSAGTYTVTVTGTSGNSTTTGKITLTVQ